MQYLVQMKLAAHSRPNSSQEGASFIEGYIFPSLERCKKLEEEKKIVAGGPMIGTIGIALILQAETGKQLDELIASLPVWPLMETTVMPLTTFDGRMDAIRPRLERLKTSMQNEPAPAR